MCDLVRFLEDLTIQKHFCLNKVIWYHQQQDPSSVIYVPGKFVLVTLGIKKQLPKSEILALCLNIRETLISKCYMCSGTSKFKFIVPH